MYRKLSKEQQDQHKKQQQQQLKKEIEIQRRGDYDDYYDYERYDCIGCYFHELSQIETIILKEIIQDHDQREEDSLGMTEVQSIKYKKQRGNTWSGKLDTLIYKSENALETAISNHNYSLQNQKQTLLHNKQLSKEKLYKQQNPILPPIYNISNINMQNITITKKIVSNIAIIDGTYFKSDIIDLNNRIHNHKLSFLITSDIDCNNLDVVFKVSMDNELYYKLHSNYIEYHCEGESSQVVIKDFIPRYMRLSITNNGFLISNTTVYLTF
jgi:hypothetical protein